MRHCEEQQVVLHGVARGRHAQLECVAPLVPDLVAQLLVESVHAVTVSQLADEHDC